MSVNDFKWYNNIISRKNNPYNTEAHKSASMCSFKIHWNYIINPMNKKEIISIIYNILHISVLIKKIIMYVMCQYDQKKFNVHWSYVLNPMEKNIVILIIDIFNCNKSID